MSCVKNWFMDEIEKLSKLTGYSYEFLLDIWNECLEDGTDWDFFKGVTLEMDW